MSKRDEFIAIADEQDKNGSGYLLGGQGEKAEGMSEAHVITREHGVAKEIKRVWAYIRKRLEQGFNTMRMFDCSGLVLWCLAQIGFNLPDKTANGIYFDLCVQINKYDLCPGDLVFKKSAAKNEMYHVGVYMGDGTVVHAKGRDDGVVREIINATRWNRFGRLKIMEPGEVICLLRTLSKGCKGADVYALELKLEAAGYDCGITSAEKSSKIGNWGPMCDKAFRAWQTAHPECGTNGKPDSRCGQKSAAALGFIKV